MKVAYVAEWDFSQVSGVSQKILSQLRCWNSLGVEARGFFITPELPASSSELKVSFFQHQHSSLLQGQLRNYTNKMLSAARVTSALEQFKPDLIYYRQNIGFPGLKKILTRSRSLVVELNSLDLHEIELESAFKKYLYLLQRNGILKMAHGFCPVSNEIARSVSDFGKPTFVCGNGIDFAHFSQANRKINLDRPQVILVGSPGQSWHGLDRLNWIAKHLLDVDFHVVGPSEKELQNPSRNIKFHGKVTGPQLKELYSEMDIGVGSLAISRKKMTEASPLKVREYGAIGMPFIYAYDDTDLTQPHLFALKISDVDQASPQELIEIDRFIKKHWKADRHPEAFKPLFNREEKERQRLQFFEKVLTA